MRQTMVVMLALALATAGCGGDAGDARPADTTLSADSHASTPGMGGMAMASGPMMQEMRAHLRAQESRSSDSLRATLPAHRQMAANLVAQLNKEMRDMNMTTDAPWQALTDSVRQDLVRLPELGAADLASVMRSHRARLERLMGMHEEMMRTM